MNLVPGTLYMCMCMVLIVVACHLHLSTVASSAPTADLLHPPRLAGWPLETNSPHLRHALL